MGRKTIEVEEVMVEVEEGELKRNGVIESEC